MLIIYLGKEFRLNKSFFTRFMAVKRLVRWIIAVFLVMLVTKVSANTSVSLNDTNKNKVVFEIIRNDKVIGIIEINRSVSGDSIIYNIESDVKAAFILKFKVVGKEKYIYKKGTLIYSSLYRTLNNKVKTNHSILYNNGQYSLKTPEKISPLNFEDIKCNLMTLYINEPIGVEYVFCDNQHQMVKVKPIGKGIYKVELSNGKYNIFHYENGRCVKIKAVSPLFNVTLIPVQQ